MEEHGQKGPKIIHLEIDLEFSRNLTILQQATGAETQADVIKKGVSLLLIMYNAWREGQRTINIDGRNRFVREIVAGFKQLFDS